MKEDRKAASIWRAKTPRSDTGLDETLVNSVVKRTQQRILFKEIITLILNGFSSIILGFIKDKPRELDEEKDHDTMG